MGFFLLGGGNTGYSTTIQDTLLWGFPHSESGLWCRDFPSQSLGFAAPLMGFLPLGSKCEAHSVVGIAPSWRLNSAAGISPLWGQIYRYCCGTKHPPGNRSPNQHSAFRDIMPVLNISKTKQTLLGEPISDENNGKQIRQDPNNIFINAFIINFWLYPF